MIPTKAELISQLKYAVELLVKLREGEFLDRAWQDVYDLEAYVKELGG